MEGEFCKESEEGRAVASMFFLLFDALGKMGKQIHLVQLTRSNSITKNFLVKSGIHL